MIVLRARFLCSTLIGLGLAVSGYLLVRHLALAGASDLSGVDVCSALFGTGCDSALRSPASVQLGLPLAGWGLLYYITLASLLFLAWYVGESFEFEATLGALFLSVVGVVISVPLFVAMLAGQLPFCPLCAAVHVINLILLEIYFT